jgi:SEC-C motif-containing protein
VTGTPCACGSGKGYAQCCGPFHAGHPAPDAERLMRSRYSAYVLHLEDYLLATWHGSTRPAPGTLALHGGTRWLGLRVLNAEAAAGNRAWVEFIAKYKDGGFSAQRLHERSEFTLEDGRWYYLGGEFLTP